MPGPQPKLHLPFADWPETDKIMWQFELDDDDPFSDGVAARLAKTTLHKYWMGWRRFLGFLTIIEPEALEIAPPERLTNEQAGDSPSTWRRRIRPTRSRSKWTASTAPPVR
jgi:hypothetical protein